MPTIVAMLNQKGGVGKSSTCHHLSGTLAKMGRRILLVDADPQASLTQGFFGPQATRQFEPTMTVAEILAGRRPHPEQCIHPSGLANVDLVPGSRAATRFNAPCPEEADHETQSVLRDFLSEAAADYDVVLIDCPPNLHACSWAALAACQHVVIPLSPEDYASQGIVDVLESIDLVRSAGFPVTLLGLLLTMVTARLTLHQLYETELRGIYGDAVFAARMPNSTDFPESIARRLTISTHKPRSAAAKAMTAIAEELLERIAASQEVGVAA